MTKVMKYIVVFITATILVSCDYFGYFNFDIVNNTNDSLKIVYVEQMQSFTTVLYTPDYDDDFRRIYLSNMLTDTVIPPKETLHLVYDAGMVDRNFPDKLEAPEDYGILPLWERIGYVILRGDTLAPETYAKGRWTGKGSTYTLIVK